VGPEWQDGRRKLQKDMFPPAAAESYLPLLDQPVRLISQQFPKVERLDQITPYAATDMFFTVMLGWNPRTVLGINGNVNKEADGADLDFVELSNDLLGTVVQIFTNPQYSREKPGPLYPKYEMLQDKFYAKNSYYVEKFLKNEEEKIKSGKEDEIKPYFRRLFDRGEMSLTHLAYTFAGLLGAGVDTTHHILIWLMLNLAKNPDKQEILRKELVSAVGNAPVEADHLKLPYLNQCIREAYRSSPITAFSNFRRLPADAEVRGFRIPKEVKISLCLNYVQKNPKYVDDADKFLPERWSSDEIEKRKNTDKEILDHKLLSKPFGFGPRMCLGARVAEIELKTLITRLVLDWRFTLDTPNEPYKLIQGTLIRPAPCPKIKFEKAT